MVSDLLMASSHETFSLVFLSRFVFVFFFALVCVQIFNVVIKRKHAVKSLIIIDVSLWVNIEHWRPLMSSSNGNTYVSPDYLLGMLRLGGIWKKSRSRARLG